MNKLKNKNAIKFFTLICLIIVLLIVYGIVRIYALFHSELNSKVQLKNGTWNIVVNNVDITKGKDISFQIDNVEIDENSHVKPGSLAPGLIGNFKISIDPKDTDVSVKYEISLNQEELTNKNLIIKSITETENKNELIKIDKNTYAGIISLEKIKAGNKNEITVEIEWLDTLENSDQDLNIGTKWDFQYKIPITLHVCQYLGEELIPYIEN